MKNIQWPDFGGYFIQTSYVVLLYNTTGASNGQGDGQGQMSYEIAFCLMSDVN